MVFFCVGADGAPLPVLIEAMQQEGLLASMHMLISHLLSFYLMRPFI